MGEHKHQMQPRVKWVSVERLRRIVASSRARGFATEISDEMLDAAGGGCHAMVTTDNRNGVVRVCVYLPMVGEDEFQAARLRLDLDDATYDSIPDADG